MLGGHAGLPAPRHLLRGVSLHNSLPPRYRTCKRFDLRLSVFAKKNLKSFVGIYLAF